MIRKLLMVAAAAAVPVSGLAIAGVVGTSTAGAKTPPPALSPTTCQMSGTVTFGPGGLSLLGVTTTAKTSTTMSTVSFSGCSLAGSSVNTSGSLNITTKNSKCASPFTGPGGLNGVSQPSNCAKGMDFTGAAAGLNSAGTFKSLGKAVKALPLTLVEPAGTVALKSKAGASSSIYPTALGGTGQCGSEAGFLIPTTLKTSPKSTGITTGTILVCLGTDNFGGNFITDLTSGGDTISSVAIDPATSSIALS